MEKKNLFKKVFSIAISCVVVMSLAGPAFALDELPATVTPVSSNRNTSLFKKSSNATVNVPSFGAMTASGNTNFEVFCLNREGTTPTNKVCTETEVKDLTIKTYDEEVLKVLLNYPILSDTVNCPHITSDKYATYSKEDREYFFRQVSIWYYQYLIADSAQSFKTAYIDVVNNNGDEDSKLLLAEIMNFVDKVRTKQIVLAKENSIKINAPASDEFILNEKTGYYESGEYVLDVKGCVGNGAVITALNLPEYMEAINSDDGKAFNVGDVVDHFMVRIPKDQIDKAISSKDVASVKVSISYTDAAYKVYKVDNTGKNQDVGVIVKEVKCLAADTVISTSVKQTTPPKKEEPKKPDKEDTPSTDTTAAPNTGDNTKQLPYLFLTTVSLGIGYVFLSKKLKSKS